MPAFEHISVSSYWYRKGEWKPTSPQEEYFYDPKGKIIKSILHHRHVIGFYKYNEAELLVELKYQHEKGYTDSIEHYFYDDQNRVFREIHEPGSGSGSWMFYDYSYEGTGKTVVLLSTPDNLEGTFEEVYSTTGLLLEEKSYRSEDDLISWRRFEYDEQNQLIKEINLGIFGKPDGYQLFYYANGEESGCDFIEKDGKVSCIHRYEKQYDSHGSWIESLTIKDGQPYRKTVRCIKYYCEK